MRTLHNITLTEEREIAPGLFSARGHDGSLRLHDGAKFRGYATTWANGRDGKPRFQVACWSSVIGRGAEFRCRTYRTMKGAERALVRKGVQLHPAGA